MEQKPKYGIARTDRKLPTIAELYDIEDIEVAFKSDQFNALMNHNPRPEWIKENKFAGNSKYLPIGIVETLLLKVFKQVQVEVLREGQLFNSVYCAVRLHYVSPVTGEWQYHDGVGAAQIQTKAGSSPADLAAINNAAVMMALPMAKSYAIKDAAEHFGRLFGRDLNRKDVIELVPDKSLASLNEQKEAARVLEHIKTSKTVSELMQVSELADYYGYEIDFAAKLNELQ